VLLLLARELADLLRVAVSARRGARPTGRASSSASSLDGSAPVPERRPPVGDVWQDIRYAGRMLRRQPGFALVAVLTLALGVGANTAVFTVVNGVLLRPLSYGDADRLVVLMYGRPGRVSPWFSPPNYLDFTTQSDAFTEAAAFAPTTSNMTGLGDPARVDGAAVSWNFFTVLKTPLPLGRAFLPDDGKARRRRWWSSATDSGSADSDRGPTSSDRRCTWTARR
jgi:hypothetical protein